MTAPTRIRLLAGAGGVLAMSVLAAGLVIGTGASDAQTAAPAAPTTVAPAAPAPEPGGGIVATIDGDPITERDLEMAYEEFRQQLASFGLDRRREVAIDLLIHIRLLAKEAAQLGIDKEPVIADRLRLVRDRALYGEMLNRAFATEVTEDAARKLFDQQQAQAGKQFEYRVRHILVPTEAEAMNVITKLDAGGDFAQLAKDLSIDPGSAPEGGELGFIGAGETVKEFETAAFGLEIGKYTKAPIESQFGFHVIELEETREAAPRTFEASIPQLQDELAQGAFQKLIDDLEAKYKVVKALPPGLQPLPAAPESPR